MKQYHDVAGIESMKPYKEQEASYISIKELPPNERPREKLDSLGALSLSDIELITIMIGSGTQKNPAMKVAHAILHILDTQPVDDQLEVKNLISIEGLGMAKATLICAALELGRRRLPSRRKQINFPGDVYPLIQHVGSRLQEHFLCIALNGAHEVMSITTVTIGLVNHTLVHPREVLP